MLERLKVFIADVTSWALLLLMVVLLLWAVLLVFAQCATWLKTGIWQPVPMVAVFMAPEAQVFNLRLTEAQVFNLRLTQGGRSPIDLAPSWASFDSPMAVAQHLSGRMVGLARILAWLMDIGLSVWLAVTAAIVGGLSGLAAEASRESAKK